MARILDANINRAAEGLRVCEDTARFVLSDRALTSRFKSIRHRLQEILERRPLLIRQRASASDVGRRISSESEMRRCSCRDIFYANMQRVKESIRVLEEYSKLQDQTAALKFKELRYRVYELEKTAAARAGRCR